MSWFQRLLDWGADRSVLLALLFVNLTALYKYWAPITAKRNERFRDLEKIKLGDWGRLRAEIVRLDERCDHLQKEVDECREREHEWMGRALVAEGYLIGRGNFRQELTVLESTERVREDKK
jgi:hypothetical protein